MASFHSRQRPVFCGRLTDSARLLLAFSLLAFFLASCGQRQNQPAQSARSVIPSFSHIFIIVLENKEYTTIIGNKQARYLNSLTNAYAVADNYYAIAHPSLPNYLALTGGSTFGLSQDCTGCFQAAPNLADQIEASGRSWKAYMESMPAPCYIGNSPDGLYTQKHDPFVYYDDIRTNKSRCTSHIVPLTQLFTDIAANHLPDYTWISPNMCNDMHSCSIAVGDKWLSQIVPTILHSDAFTHDGVLFITFDEGKSGASCCGDAQGGKIVSFVISPLVRAGWRSNTPETHYSLLRTVEASWGLSPLGNAARSAPMGEYFLKR